MNSTFALEPTPSGLVVSTYGKRRIPVNEWTVQLPVSSGAGTLIRLRDEDRANESSDHLSLQLHWNTVAEFDTNLLHRIGLPQVCPYSLEISTRHSIYDSRFRIDCGFLSQGRRILNPERVGAWINIGNDSYILLTPVYDIVCATESFNKHEGSDLVSRMFRWGRIAKLLPSETVVDENLRSFRIVVASAFELVPFINEQNEIDFDPIIGQIKIRETDGESNSQLFSPVIPNDQQIVFGKRFRALTKAQRRYSVGNNSFVVFTPQLECALQVVREAQTTEATERRKFLDNVSAYLRGQFDRSDNADFQIDQVYRDDTLSDRVRGIGTWHGRSLPWIRMSGEKWLPPEELGLRIGSDYVSIRPEELPRLLAEVQDAIEEGKDSVVASGGVSLPANESTRRSLEELIRQTQPTIHPSTEGPTVEPDHSSQRGDCVLIILDNLEAINFDRKRSKRPNCIYNAIPTLQQGCRLFPHQKECLAWLKNHWVSGSSGALLADDMGLGKTLEALAFLSCVKTCVSRSHNQIQCGPILIVAPTGLLRNWEDEHNRHLASPGLGRSIGAYRFGLRDLRLVDSTAGNELKADHGLPKLNVDKLSQADWVLTTYETLRDYQHSFGRVRWLVAVFDEAQKIKNPAARITEAVLAMNVDFSLLMTGTPVENRPADIWPILDRSEPGCLGTLKAFSKRYEGGGDHQMLALEELNSRLTNSTTTLPPRMLRRNKESSLAKLPRRVVHRRVVTMPLAQASRYENVLSTSVRSLSVLELLHRLRSISLHPFAPFGFDIDEYIQTSARLAETFRILDEINEKEEKVLVFVESITMQDFLVGTIRQRFDLDSDVLVINGKVSGNSRKKRVDLFQHRRGFDVMVLSPKAGGVGLTLTAANHVVHLSRWWNPAVEDQCSDRVYRIGQKNPVHIYYPLAKHPQVGEYSFDLKLDALISRKRSLNKRVLAPTSSSELELDALYGDTGRRARQRIDFSGGEEWCDTEKIDLMEPERFERWVMKQLNIVGYLVNSTPISGDRGADVLARWLNSGEEHTLFIQCKHVQSVKKCGVSAVREVLRAIPHYPSIGSIVASVVTNASGFTLPAKRLANRNDVVLIDRQCLCRIRDVKFLRGGPT